MSDEKRVCCSHKSARIIKFKPFSRVTLNLKGYQGHPSSFVDHIDGTASRVAQSVECLATGWTTGRSRFDPRQRQKDLSSSLCIQTCSGAHPASCTMGTEGPFPGAKARPGRDSDHSPPSSAEVENE
jgi:hypothetical protein